MLKIYPKKNIFWQIVIKLTKYEIIFTSWKDFLLIDSIFFHHKIDKKEIKAINLILKSGELNRIFIVFETKTRIEFHIWDKKNQDKNIFKFFQTFLKKENIIIY